MKRITYEPKLNYSILIFVTIFPVSISRPISAILEGVGRNSVWFLFPILLLALAGTWMSLQISKRCGDVSLMLACGEILFRWATPVAYILYGILYLGIAAYTIALSGDFSSRVFQYGDSRDAIVTDVLITACAALFPMETLIRYSQVLMIIGVPVFFAATLSMLTETHWSWLQPMFHVQEMIHPDVAAATVMGMLSPLAAVTLISRKHTNVTFLSLSGYMTLLTVLVSYLVAMSIAAFGIHTAQKMEYVVFYGQSAVHIENFIFERVIFWGSVLLIYFKVVGNAFLMRCAALSLAQTLGIRLGVVPILLVSGITAAVFWKVDLPYFFLMAPLWLGYYSFLLLFVFPALLYAILLLRRIKT
ncbi:hypothetical protein J31TS4_38490 [Paenibacillus sp. J31TS4]|uniref:hypothetical protein n=1 Tax=Paenibacillus sp. J31TS4 TaxID=2807195 RepID=UPI001B17662F|nr:hypothetical protein [Paenibacillus sp. J31TS4]GIP40569.1 hypothetical protein J31TS4_38490 [Paenibacillus sp. J31TS4]